MFNKKVLKSLATACFLVTVGNATEKFTLDQMITEVIEKNPVIQEKLHQYESIVYEADMSKSGYYPTINLSAKSGKRDIKQWDDPNSKDKFDSSEISLKLVQNIFNATRFKQR